MSLSVTVKRGDTRQPLIVGLSYDDGTSPALAGLSARFIMRRYPDQSLVVDADLVGGNLALDDVDKLAIYNWQPEDVDEEGVFIGEVETDDGQTLETFPTSGQIVITIEPDLG
jgi:hypothetical protein